MDDGGFGAHQCSVASLQIYRRFYALAFAGGADGAGGAGGTGGFCYFYAANIENRYVWRNLNGMLLLC